MKITSLIPAVLFASVALLSGCASSPVTPGASGRSGFSRAGVTAVGIGGAALAGQNMSHSKYAAPIGAVAGYAVSSIVNSALDKSSARAVAEAREQGRREARVEVLNQFWYDKTTSYHTPRTASSGQGTAYDQQFGPAPQEQVVTYEAGTYEGVNMLPHAVSVPAPR